jgi:4-hydroxy-3-methylbut-2-enyl diphosphate reductase
LNEIHLPWSVTLYCKVNGSWRNNMRIIRAEHLGMCFGVRDAIALAHKEVGAGPLTVLGELVHNDTVLAQLRAAGVHFRNDAREVTTDTVMITAHGASERKLGAVRARGLRVLEATCPLVHVAHNALKKLVREGGHPVVIGRRDHAEVRGLTEDFEEFDVVLSEADIAAMHERDRLGVVAQTTQPIERVRHLVALIRQRFPKSDVRFMDTVCQPTKQRQNAAVELAQQCDVVIVIGGAHSNNTRELVETCARHCTRVGHVQSAAELSPEWFRADDTVGITAGTSTPDSVITEIERCLRLRASNFNEETKGVPT